jgi:flagellar biosynthesis component FlhA
MISISGGLIVTRASSDANLGLDIQKRVFGNPQPLFLAAGVLIAMAAFPGLPKASFSGPGGRRWNNGLALAAKSCHSRQGKTSSGAAGARHRQLDAASSRVFGLTEGNRDLAL